MGGVTKTEVFFPGEGQVKGSGLLDTAYLLGNDYEPDSDSSAGRASFDSSISNETQTRCQPAAPEKQVQESETKNLATLSKLFKDKYKIFLQNENLNASDCNPKFMSAHV